MMLSEDDVVTMLKSTVKMEMPLLGSMDNGFGLITIQLQWIPCDPV